MRMRKLAFAAMILALAGTNHAVARDNTHGHSRHARHGAAKPANPPETPSAMSAAEPSDQRHPDDLALDQKIKSICRGC